MSGIPVFVATRDTQGYEPGDHCFAQEGELLRFVGSGHDQDPFEQGDAMIGVQSQRSTTTFRVAVYPGWLEALVDEFMVSWKRAFGPMLWRWHVEHQPTFEADLRANERRIITYLSERASQFPVGTVLCLRKQHLQVRETPEEGHTRKVLEDYVNCEPVAEKEGQ